MIKLYNIYQETILTWNNSTLSFGCMQTELNGVNFYIRAWLFDS